MRKILSYRKQIERQLRDGEPLR